jgi:hypothetical protein
MGSGRNSRTNSIDKVLLGVSGMRSVLWTAIAF